MISDNPYLPPPMTASHLGHHPFHFSNGVSPHPGGYGPHTPRPLMLNSSPSPLLDHLVADRFNTEERRMLSAGASLYLRTHNPYMKDSGPANINGNVRPNNIRGNLRISDIAKEGSSKKLKNSACRDTASPRTRAADFAIRPKHEQSLTSPSYSSLLLSHPSPPLLTNVSSITSHPTPSFVTSSPNSWFQVEKPSSSTTSTPVSSILTTRASDFSMQLGTEDFSPSYNTFNGIIPVRSENKLQPLVPQPQPAIPLHALWSHWNMNRLTAAATAAALVHRTNSEAFDNKQNHNQPSSVNSVMATSYGENLHGKNSFLDSLNSNSKLNRVSITDNSSPVSQSNAIDTFESSDKTNYTDFNVSASNLEKMEDDVSQSSETIDVISHDNIDEKDQSDGIYSENKFCRRDEVNPSVSIKLPKPVYPPIATSLLRFAPYFYPRIAGNQSLIPERPETPELRNPS